MVERFPRGTLPPSGFRALKPVPAPERRDGCDLSTMCPTCNIAMQPEHAHYRCARCGYRDSCCF
jgi:hypothetical protein|nr:hypothetical protein [Kofleriaceae bacterium]